MKVSAWQFKQFLVAAGEKGSAGDAAFGKTADGKVYEGVAGTGFVFVGKFAEDFDASASGPLGNVDQLVNIDLGYERTVFYAANAGDVTAANLFSYAYFTDAETVTAVSTGHTKAGMIVDVDPVKGVGFVVGSYTSEE